MAAGFDSATATYLPLTETAPGAATIAAGDVLIKASALEGVASQAAAEDIRQVMYSILESFADNYLAQTIKSENVTVNRSSSVPSDTILRKTYTVTFNLEIPSLSVETDGDV